MSTTKKILILASNPKDKTRLRLDEEVRQISEVIRRSKNRDQFNIEQRWAVRPRDLRQALLDYDPQIVHFCGHGDISGIILEDDNGEAVFVKPDALSGLFEILADDVECVILNACYSELQANAISQHVDYVIGMSTEIGDEAAIEFAVGFYAGLTGGRSLSQAFRLGCNALQLRNIPEHLTPILKKKSDHLNSQVQLILESEINNFSEATQSNLASLTAVLTWITLLRESLSSESKHNPKVEKYLDRIDKDIRLILGETKELRKPLAMPETVDIEEVIGTIVGHVKIMTSPHIEIVFEPELVLPTIHCVKHQISAAIYSVIQNAIKAISGPGKILIELKSIESETEDEKYLEINISDTGCGIPADKRDFIFEFGTSYWSDRKGTGHGLWRARGIIQSVGGNIRVKNSLAGMGTTVTIALPTV